MSKRTTTIVSTITDSLASPVLKYHEDELETKRYLQCELHAHEERMRAMELQSEEDKARYIAFAEYMRTLQVAMETENMNPALAESLMKVPLMIE